MFQIAVFVDAGYVYSQGSALLKGKKLSRDSIRLTERKILEKLAEFAGTIAPDSRLLRIYWYDGLPRGNRPSMEQDLIGQSPNAKLRLGLVNTKGQQKGVDSLIVTDLIELARNQAITDALILSGDEDIKIGVQVAQTYGVRIHLLGIKPAKGSQSDGLMMEADTCHEWNESVVRDWMHFVDLVTDATRASVSGAARHDDSGTQYSHSLRRESEVPDDFEAIIASESTTVISTLAEPDLTRHVAYLKENPGRIHHDLDRRFLARVRNRLCRDLTDQERKEYRRVFAEALRTAHSGTRPR